ncbi:MAG TPA: hypothetical protein VGQ26_29305 [Streptosporangiaceae bacterium]|nr:hypothetical protein [Streptosporangiaceae bacterium]
MPHGGRTTTYEVVISDEAGRRVCTSRPTCLAMDRLPGKGGRGGAVALGHGRSERRAVRTGVTVRAAEHPVRHKANQSRRDVYGIPTRE